MAAETNGDGAFAMGKAAAGAATTTLTW